MLEWYADSGGGEYNGSPGNLPGTGLTPSNVQGSISQASQEQAHSGSWSAKLSIPGTGAVRLWRWQESLRNNELYYSVWYFVPQRYTVNAGGWTDWFFYKSTTPGGKNDPFFLMGWQNTASGGMQLNLYWWQSAATEGPFPGTGGPRTWVSPIELPIGRWFQLEARYVCAGDFTGAIQVWQDGVEIFKLEGIRTRYPDGTCVWAVANYGANISPSPHVIYIDDVVVSKTRVGP